MSKEQLKANLLSLERKINLLVGEHKTLKLEVSQLKSENDELRSLIKSKEEQISSFQNQIKISKIVDSMAVEDDTAELKFKINEYIKDIDKCIALLSK